MIPLHLTKADLEQACAQFHKVVNQLTDLMAFEKGLLNDRKYRELEKIQPEKSRLAAEYQLAMKALRPFKDALQHDFKDIRDELAATNETFQEHIKQNGRLLMRGKTISEGIISAISAEARRQSPTVSQYGPHHLNKNKSISQSRSVPIAINQSV